MRPVSRDGYASYDAMQANNTSTTCEICNVYALGIALTRIGSVMSKKTRSRRKYCIYLLPRPSAVWRKGERNLVLTNAITTECKKL